MINERHIYRYCCRNGDSENPHSATLCGSQQPNPAQRVGSGGGRNARATSTHSRAFPISPGNSPSRITGLPPVRRNHRSASLRRSHVFGEPTLRQIVGSRNRKAFRACAEAVDDETSLWRAEENRKKSPVIRNFHHPHSPSLTKIPRRTLGCCRCGLRQDSESSRFHAWRYFS